MKIAIPKEAQPIARILRRDVPRPRDLPACKDGLTHPRWKRRRKYESYKVWTCHVCPMGLHPKAKDSIPTTTYDFPAAAHIGDVKAFYEWWDSITPGQVAAAVDAIWPKKRSAKR